MARRNLGVMLRFTWRFEPRDAANVLHSRAIIPSHPPSVSISKEASPPLIPIPLPQRFYTVSHPIRECSSSLSPRSQGN